MSTTLKGYLTNVINFYDQLFQHLAGPAHSHKSQESNAEKTSMTATSPRNQQDDTDFQPSSEKLTDVNRPPDKTSSNLSKQALSPQGGAFRLLIIIYTPLPLFKREIPNQDKSPEPIFARYPTLCYIYPAFLIQPEVVLFLH